MKRILLPLMGLLLALPACGSSDRGDGSDGGSTDADTDSDTDADTDSDTDSDSDTDDELWENGCSDTPSDSQVRLTGRVMGPGGLFPVARALVAAYSDPGAIPEIPDHAYCEECVDITGIPAVQTSPDGAFCLDVPAGMSFSLMVQKGQFRRIREYDAPDEAGSEEEIEAALTTLPSISDETLGDTIPRMALAIGDYDRVQDVLAKAGMGELEMDYTFVEGSETGIWHAFDNVGDGSFPDNDYGYPIEDLLTDLDQMLNYHIIFFPCTYNSSKANYLALDADVQQNLRDYVWAGGKLYVSDYSYYLVDMPWTDFIDFVDPLYGGCVETDLPTGCNHGPSFDTPGTVLDELMAVWVDLLMEEDGLDLEDLMLLENFDTIGSVGEGYVGQDPEDSSDLYAPPKVWVEGPWAYEEEDWPASDFDAESSHPLTVSWPYNCGRVVYTTYHTIGDTGSGHYGLLYQERMLYFLLMEIGVCQDDVAIIE